MNLQDHPLVKGALRERERLIGPRAARPKTDTDRSAAAAQHLATLASGLRLLNDLGCSREQARRGLVAGHRAMLRELAEADPMLASRVADETREAVAVALQVLSEPAPMPGRPAAQQVRP